MHAGVAEDDVPKVDALKTVSSPALTCVIIVMFVCSAKASNKDIAARVALPKAVCCVLCMLVLWIWRKQIARKLGFSYNYRPKSGHWGCSFMARGLGQLLKAIPSLLLLSLFLSKVLPKAEGRSSQGEARAASPSTANEPVPYQADLHHQLSLKSSWDNKGHRP